MRSIALVIFILYLAFPAFPVQPGTDRLAQDKVRPAPSLKKLEKAEVVPPKVRKRYDRALDVTYVNVTIPLTSQDENKVSSGVATWEMNINFQLVYRGSSTTDLITAYLIIDSTAGKDQVEKFASVHQVEINADGYQYSYQRRDYKTDVLEASGLPTNTLPLKKESIVIKLPLDDLSQIAYANKLDIKLGKVELTMNSIQLIDLRSTLLAGGR